MAIVEYIWHQVQHISNFRMFGNFIYPYIKFKYICWYLPKLSLALLSRGCLQGIWISTRNAQVFILCLPLIIDHFVDTDAVKHSLKRMNFARKTISRIFPTPVMSTRSYLRAITGIVVYLIIYKVLCHRARLNKNQKFRFSEYQDSISMSENAKIYDYKIGE